MRFFPILFSMMLSSVSSECLKLLGTLQLLPPTSWSIKKYEGCLSPSNFFFCEKDDFFRHWTFQLLNAFLTPFFGDRVFRLLAFDPRPALFSSVQRGLVLLQLIFAQQNEIISDICESLGLLSYCRFIILFSLYSVPITICLPTFVSFCASTCCTGSPHGRV